MGDGLLIKSTHIINYHLPYNNEYWVKKMAERIKLFKASRTVYTMWTDDDFQRSIDFAKLLKVANINIPVWLHDIVNESEIQNYTNSSICWVRPLQQMQKKDSCSRDEIVLSKQIGEQKDKKLRNRKNQESIELEKK